jgi:F-box-like
VNETTADRFDVGQVTIDTLPDDVLLTPFDFFRTEYARFSDLVWGWEQLAHVCRRWRSIIFALPQRLQLRVFCDGLTPTRTSLDIWPPLPIAVRYPH